MRIPILIALGQIDENPYPYCIGVKFMNSPILIAFSQIYNKQTQVKNSYVSTKSVSTPSIGISIFLSQSDIGWIS